jgi:hypothetical protein
MRPNLWGGPPGPHGSPWTRSAFKESRRGPAPMWRAPHTLRHAVCGLLAIALGAGLAGVAASATATTATKTSTTKSTGAATHTAAKARAAKPTPTNGPTTHKAATAKVATATRTTATRTAQPRAAAHPAASPMAKSAATAAGTRSKTTRKVGTALAKNRKSPKGTPRQRVQAVPTPDRYQEIQQALADRGFYKGEVNGTWGPDSVGALKAFQVSQKLPDDGKINALSLIGLGLGAKHISVSGPPPSAPTPAGQTPSGVTGDSTGPGPVAPIPPGPQVPPGPANSGGTTNPQQPASPAPASPAPGAPQNGQAAPSPPHVPGGSPPPGVSE